MLVPFNLNEEKIKELNIPHHVADWHRIRILKEIDDIRYRAMTIANIDLTGEAMESLKKLKLFSLFEPVIDYVNKVRVIKSYNNIVEAFDLPLDWYFKAANDLFDFLYQNGLNVTPEAMLRAIRDDQLKVVSNFQGTKCFFFFLPTPVYINISVEEAEKRRKEYLLKFKDASFSAFNFMDYSGNFNFDNENNISFWNVDKFYGYKNTIQKALNINPTCVKLEYNTNYSDYLYFNDNSNYPPTRIMSDIIISDVVVYIFDYINNYLGYSSTRSYGTRTFPTFSSTDAFYFFNPSDPAVPEILKCEIVLGYISSQVMHNAPLSSSLSVLKLSTVNSWVDQNTPIVCEEPYVNYLKTSSGATTYTLANTDERPYNVSLTYESKSYYQYYKTQRISLENGKSFTLPFDTFKYKNPYGTNLMYSESATALGRFNLGWDVAFRLSDGSTTVDNDEYNVNMTLSSYSIVDDIRTPRKAFFDFNRQFYSFPPYFPRILLFNSNRIRNGVLYSDASKYYQLEFLKYPESTLDKIDELIDFQDTINDLWFDIKNKVCYFDKTSTYSYSWYYLVDGIKNQLLHPVTSKPVSGIRYLYELIFEMIIKWGIIQDEIDAYLNARKVQNENAYNQAYQNYLRGQATINGPDSLALYEEKLKTGIFYIENGFEYWRKFTDLEMSLIEKFKANAYENAKIVEQNKQIVALNQQYQDAANLPIIVANDEKMAMARLLAIPQLRPFAEAQIKSIVPPTIDYLLNRAEVEGGFPTDILKKWTEENPMYYVRPDLVVTVNNLLAELTLKEQQVATALVSEAIAEVKFTQALQEIFDIKG
jgi:hypothetical protein